jgi:hypothetical protein
MADRPVVFHTGDNPGFKSISVWLPDHDASIAILTNDDTTDVERVLRQLVGTHGHPVVQVVDGEREQHQVHGSVRPSVG